MKSYTKDLQVFGTAQIGAKGQFVIPSEARKMLNLCEGDKLVIVGSAQKGFLGVMREDVFREFLAKMREKFFGFLKIGDKIELKSNDKSDKPKESRE